MRNRLLLFFLPLLLAWQARAQSLLQTESFETDGNSTRYTTTVDNPPNANQSYFLRASNPVSGFLAPSGVTGINGTYFWASENVKGSAGIGPAQNVTLGPISVRNYSTQVQVALADAVQNYLPGTKQWENNDFIRIQVRYDEAGSWITIGQFVGDNATAGTGGRLRQDTDRNGVSYDEPSAPVLTGALTDYTFTVPTLSTTLEVRVEVDQAGTSEEFAFDNIRVIGTAAASAAPVLANIESTTIPYAEGGPATQITNTLTVTDDGPTLSKAAITIASPGYDNTEDQLRFINQGSITGSFNTSTGTLTLSGTASLADYQTALRSIQYLDTDAADASAGTRTVNFTVTDQTGVTSNSVARSIVVTTSLNAAVALPFTEDFTDNNEGTRYGSNHFANTSGVGFERTNLNPYYSALSPTYSNLSGSYYWHASATSMAQNPDPLKYGYWQTQPLSAAGFGKLTFSLLLGAASNQWESDDYFKLYYRVSNGSWVLFGSFRGNTSTANGNGQLQQDTDLTNLSGLPTGLILTPALATVSFALPAALNGATVDFRIETSASEGHEDIAFDLIKIAGVQLAAPTVTTAAASAVTTSSAVLGGNVTSDGGAGVTDRGVVYSATNTTPTSGGSNTSKVPSGTGTGSYAQTITGLAASTTYYVRAYATNSEGTSYGAVQSFTTLTPTTVVSVTGTTPSPTATTTVSYQVVFSTSVTGVALSNFSLVTSGLTGASLTSVAGSGTTYTVVVNTGSGDGTLTLNVPNGAGISPTVTNTPYTSGTTYTIQKSFTSPTLSIRAAGSASNGSDVTAFIDQVQVLQGGSSFANGLQNGSFETYNALANGDYGYNPTGATWTFSPMSGIARNGSNFSPATAPNGSAVAFLQSTSGNNGTISQSLALPTGSYQVGFQASQRNCCSTPYDQVLNAFINNVFVGSSQPTSTTAYAAFTSSTFSVTAPALTASISSSTGAPGSTTATSPLAFSVAFSQSVGTTFTAADVVVTNGTLSGFSGSGTTYSFSVTPTASGTVTVSVPANVANDANNTGNTAATPFSIIYQGVTASPVLTTPANYSLLNTRTPSYSGTAPAGSTVTVYVDGTSVGTTTATGGNFNLQQGTALADGSHTVYATAQASGSTVSANSATNTFTVDATAPVVSSSNRQNPTTSATNATALTYRITFSETVTGFDASDLTLTTVGTVAASGFAVAAVSGSTYDVTVSGVSGNGTARLDVNSSNTGITDQAGNALSGGFTSGQTFTLDHAAPLATISSDAGASGSSTTVAPIPFKVVFSESVTGFTASGVSVTNGTLSGFSGSGNTYTFNVVPAASGAVTVSVAANVAQDAVGNGNTAAGPFTITYSLPVTVAPVLTAPANGSTLTTTTPSYSGTAPAGSTVTVYVDGTSVGTTTATSGSFSLQQGTALADGSHTVYATAQASGSTVSSRSNINTFVTDVAPTVSLAGTAGTSTSTAPLAFTATFSKSVTGFAAGGIAVTNGTVTSSAVSGSGTSYSFSVTPSANGTVTVSINANAAQDSYGTGNVASATYSIGYSAPITATTWTGTVSTDWYTDGNWSAGVPTVTIDATVNAGSIFAPRITAGTANARALVLAPGATLALQGGTLNLTGNFTNNGIFTATGGAVDLSGSASQSVGGTSTTRFFDLRVGASGGTLSGAVEISRVLTLNGGLTTNRNLFTLLSSAATGDALVVNNGGVVNGDATVQRAIDPSLNPGMGYRHYAAPVANARVLDLTTAGFVPVVNPNYNTSATPTTERPFPTVMGYDESRGQLANNLSYFDRGFYSPSTLNTLLTVGRGYTVNIGAKEVVNFVGTLNNGIYPVTMTSDRVNNPSGGWQLVGNPYPSPLNYSTVAAADRVQLEGAIYVYSSTSQYAGQYRAYVNNMGGGNPIIPAGQGFFVRVQQGQTSGSLTFRNSQRLTTPTTTTFQRTAADTRPQVQLTLRGASTTFTDDAYVYFEAGATAEFDAQYDAGKLANSTGLNLSSQVSGKELAINGLPALGTQALTVPLTVRVPAAGTYSLTAAQLLNLTGTPVYLRDTQLGTLTDLRQQASYSFTLGTTTAGARFELLFSPQQALATVPAALAQQVLVYPNPAHSACFIELPVGLSRQPVTATLVDALGRAVSTQVLPASLATHSLPLADVATGVYSLHLHTEAGVVVKKLVVE